MGSVAVVDIAQFGARPRTAEVVTSSVHVRSKSSLTLAYGTRNYKAKMEYTMCDIQSVTKKACPNIMAQFVPDLALPYLYKKNIAMHIGLHILKQKINGAQTGNVLFYAYI